MPRPKAYNEEEVLTATMVCFWHQGYTATSLKHLEEATGLKPSSLYNAFESKDALFLRALDHYINIVVRPRANTLLANPDPIAGIQDYFRQCFNDKHRDFGIGCLLINTSTEMGPHDKLIQAKVAQGMRLVEKTLRKALTQAQSNGQLDHRVDCKQRAAHLGLLLSGMLVTVRVANNRHWLAAAMKSVNALLQ